MTYRDRRLARAERLREWAEKRQRRSAAAFKSAASIADNIPLGQPILVGHHSEKRHRRDIARIDNGMRAGHEHQEKARDMASRADGIEHAAEHAIYRDDPDAVERLTAKIAGLEAERERRKRANAIIRSKRPDDVKIAELIAQCAEGPANAAVLLTPDFCGRLGYPPYSLLNLGGNITRERNRLAELTAAKTPSGTPTPEPTAETATARAGLTVIDTMTTPSRPGKQPRQVWNVTGNLAFWRPLLVDTLGGNWYRSVVSFWSDPTDNIETACRDAEQLDAERQTAREEASTTI